MIAVTGATGHLGRLVIHHLLKSVPPASIVATVRTPSSASEFAARGVQIRQADYDNGASFDQALAGVDRLLLISSSEVGKRAVQHRNVIDAARRQKVKLVVYTSLLHADRSPLSLAGEHLDTEAALKASGIPFIILRNGWYTENYTGSVPAALANGAFYGSAGNGRISSAARADYAEAAAKVVAGNLNPNQTLELAGDDAYTLTDLAAEISRQSGKTIPYRDIPEADYSAALKKAGLPEPLAAAIASYDVGTSKGALFDDGRQLSKLIGHRTTPLAEVVRQALKK